MMFKTFLCASVLAASAFGAEIPFFGAGVKLGAPLIDAFNVSSNPTFATFAASSSHFTVGPYVELRLPFGLGLEVDALHRGYEYRNAGSSFSNSSWEFPVLAKYRLFHGPIRPFVDGGLSFRKLNDVAKLNSFAAVLHSNTYGIVLGGGLEIKTPAVRFTPEIRYTGYTFLTFDSVLRTNRNQATFLVGIGF